MLRNFLTCNLYLGISERERKLKRTIIQYLVVLVAVRHNERVGKHNGWCTATQTRTNVIAVESLTVVEMERCGTVHKVYSLLIANTTEESLVDIRLPCHGITMVNVKLPGTLKPHVYAIGFLSRTLQSRTIHTISGNVVLPCYVVHTPGILFAKDVWLEVGTVALLHRKLGCTLRSNRHIEEQSAVVCYLVSDGLPVRILHYQAAALLNPKLSPNILGTPCHHFLALMLRGIGSRKNNFGIAVH